MTTTINLLVTMQLENISKMEKPFGEQNIKWIHQIFKLLKIT